jgi:glycosyltransferase involved in cell wall biosynthesis
MKNKFKIRLEVSSTATANISGVGMYTKAMAEALDKNDNVSQEIVYFNFLNRQPSPKLKIKQSKTKQNMFVPLKFYAKMQSMGSAWPFDIFKSKVNLTIFPNFATWPTVKSEKVATTIHDLTYLYFPETVEKKNLAHLKRAVPETIDKADIVLTVSNAVKDEIIKEFKIDADKILVTHNSVSDEFLKKISNSEIESIKLKYGIDTSKKYIYFIGNFEPRKNLTTLVQAYSLLPKEIKNEYVLVMAGGKGWNSFEAEAEIAKSRLKGDQILHIGYVDQEDSPAIYQGASLFVFPSIYEGFGIPVLEAMASSCPVVASDIPSLREAAGNAAIFANPQSESDFTRAIIEVLTKKDMAHKLVELGKKNILKFNWEDNISRLMDKVGN